MIDLDIVLPLKGNRTVKLFKDQETMVDNLEPAHPPLISADRIGLLPTVPSEQKPNEVFF
jgi:hypothetical protein